MTFDPALPRFSRNDAREFGYNRSTSDEIAMAILEIAEDVGRSAHDVWAEPTVAEMAAVEDRAWQLADDDIDELQWGTETVRRRERAR